MAAFTPPDPDDRDAFDAHIARVRSSSEIILRAVTCDGQLAGSIASFIADGHTEVTYWIALPAWAGASPPEHWRCCSSWCRTRPLHARGQRQCRLAGRPAQMGFQVVGTENSFALGRNANIEETILRPDTQADALICRRPSRLLQRAKSLSGHACCGVTVSWALVGEKAVYEAVAWLHARGLIARKVEEHSSRA